MGTSLRQDNLDKTKTKMEELKTTKMSELVLISLSPAAYCAL
jgi:hypothetical protein